MIDLKELATKVETIAKETGEFILLERTKVKAGDIELKSLNSLVSYVDKTAEEKIISYLQTLIPEAGFIAEEETTSIQGRRYNWIIDPLDGTTNYLHGIPVFAISIALMDGGDVVVGVIYELGQQEMFTAWKDGGAYLNGERIKVSRNTRLSETLLATGFPYYDFGRMESFLKLIEVLFKKTRGVRRLGSAATDMAYVACGRFDGFFEYGLHAWDVAAGVLLVLEAGGKISDYKGGDNYIFGEEILVAAPGIYEEIAGLVKQYMEGADV